VRACCADGRVWSAATDEYNFGTILRTDCSDEFTEVRAFVCQVVRVVTSERRGTPCSVCGHRLMPSRLRGYATASMTGSTPCERLLTLI
jgi:hypothetical protein